MNCPRCSARFTYSVQFCSGCGNNVELQRALCDFEYGDFEARIAGICAIAKFDKDRLQELSPRIDNYLAGIKPDYALRGAMVLQTNGVDNPRVTTILLHNLDNFNELRDEEQAKLLNAVSTMRNNPEVVSRLKSWAHGSFFRSRMLCTLGAIGESTAKPFLEYWADRGEAGAIAALRLFGIASVKEISDLFEQVQKTRR